MKTFNNITFRAWDGQKWHYENIFLSHDGKLWYREQLQKSLKEVDWGIEILTKKVDTNKDTATN